MLNKLLFFGFAALIAFGAWWGISSSGTGEQPLIATESTLNQGAAGADGLLSLRTITLSSTIFNDPLFRVLIDVGVDIVPELAGKRNPFAQPADAAPAGTLPSSFETKPKQQKTPGGLRP
ncbi:hypothetical protein EBR66_00765 [bacterium]|nr:hypothetical protein [bacterium]